MAALLEERSKRQSNGADPAVMKRPARDAESSLKSLVASVKRKSAPVEQSGAGKRRR